ncbi:hypothetical protein MXE97_22645 [Escherichia coli]|nr:hypothetical protein [Escherichia coli]
MVEKISNSSVSIAVNIDAGADDHTLLMWINKKKKHQQEGGEPLPTIAMLPEIPIKLIHSPISCGGFLKTEVAGKQTVTLELKAQREHPHVMVKSEVMRPLVPHAMSDSVQNNVHLNKYVPSDSHAAIHSKDESQREHPHVMVKSEVMRPLVPHAMSDSVQNNVHLNKYVPSDSHAAIHSKDESQREHPHVMVKSEVMRPLVPHAMSDSVQNNVHLNKYVPATLQQLKMQASTVQSGVKTDFNSQTLEVDYVFQRWSGDHSVKVFLPTQVLREGTVTLLPSDSHAAYVLSHNIGLLHGLTPELLQPQQEHDQQQRQQYQQQDEEQE